ncbi:molybdopterin-dependent oxidoreductase [Actinoplanes friuliensis]|uniref:Oxidoreductase molybdopterin binding protein n=1 Tax=Actinoplanes friuliensis DSM 7358 TaxID=1246995 RepID=U5W4V2_9ACTN|nr:molybdopterin-dependent oxidoreductase [Actinoplanes friuliensis]AGZ42966.1 oxidoreductase molybdopterin binding protein [Actinoplanes friuliensis DSM 7358]
MVRNTDPGLKRSIVARVVDWVEAPLPQPPAALRRGPLQDGAFDSKLRSPRLTSILGIALAVAFSICLVTGLISHFIQHPPAWFWWPSRPAGLYRVTQGLHVATGLASVPLLGAKLWSVYPRLFGWPPARNLAHAAERASIAVLVAASLFQVLSGILNISRWYAPMPFFFTAGHYWAAWLATGALVTHIGVKLPIIRQALVRATPDRTAPGALSRRGLLGTVGAAAGVITLATVGQTVAPLAPVSVLAPRRPRTGPQHLPVNKTAAGAGVRDAAFDPAYRLTIAGPGKQVSLSLAELGALPQHTVILPISCVEGWSSTATWTGVRLRDLVVLVGGDPQDAEAYVESLEARGRYRAATVPPTHTRDPFTLIALRLGGEALHPDHGYPARLIAPNRPGVLQTKWVTRITVRSTS